MPTAATEQAAGLAVKAAQLHISPITVTPDEDKPVADLAPKEVPENVSFSDFLNSLKSNEDLASAPLRFQAAATDGGVDASFAQMVYWADNMFVANCLQPYCSMLGKGVSVLGSLQVEAPSMDVEQDTYVHLLKQLLRTCLKHVQQLQQLAGNGYEGPFFPDSLPLSALEQLFAMTWESCTATPELSMKSIVKEVAEVVEGSAADIHKRAKAMVEDIAVKYSAADAAEASENAPSATLAPPTPRHFSPYYKVFPHPSHPHVVMDAELMPKLLTRHGDSAPQSIGFVSDIEVNRKGGLSCPVRTGAVLACCHSPGTSIMHDANANNGAMEASISEAAKEGCAQALDKLETAALSALRSCDSFDALRKLESSGTIPTIRTVKVHRSHSFFQGVTVEFDPPKGGFSKELRPLLWFQFFTSEEDKALQQWEAGALGILESTSEATEASGTPSPALPDNLAWVPKHFNPQLRAAELEAERARDASMLSLKSPAGGLRSPAPALASPFPAAHRAERATADSDDVMNDSDDEVLSGWSSESDGLVGEEDMAGIEDLWLEHLQCVHTHGRHKLKVALQEPCAANLVSIVLTDQEVIEDLRGDEDDGEDPNIDISFVKFKGTMIFLTPGTVAYKEVYN